MNEILTSMMKVSAFIGISLDGFIARSDGAIDWLTEGDTKVTPGEDFGFSSFLAGIDVIIMGKKTFEQVVKFDHWPYKDKKIIVLTSRQINIPHNLSHSVTISNESPNQLITRLSSQFVSHIYVDGGKVIQSFLSEGLVDEMNTTIVPILIGKGRSFSESIPRDILLHNSKITVYEFGAVQIKYTVIKTDKTTRH